MRAKPAVVWGLAFNWKGYDQDPLVFVKDVRYMYAGFDTGSPKWLPGMRPEIEVVRRLGSDRWGLGCDFTRHVPRQDPHWLQNKLPDASWVKMCWPLPDPWDVVGNLWMQVNEHIIFDINLDNMRWGFDKAEEVVRQYGARDGDFVMHGTPYHNQVELQKNDVVMGGITNVGICGWKVT